MYCLMCFSAIGIFQKLQRHINIDMMNKIMCVLPQLEIWDTKEDLVFCAACLEQVTTFYAIKETSLENFRRLKHYEDMLKEGNYCELREIKIKINPNYEELLLTAYNNVPTYNKEEDKIHKRLNRNISYSKQMNKNPDINISNEKASKSRKLASKKRKYKCYVCLKKFLSSNNLENHIRIHTGERPYKCLTCHKAFTRKHHLDIHKLTHTNEKPCECDVCGRTFLHRGNLTAHKNRRHSIDRPRPFRCSVCSKTFTEAGNLNKHVQIHSEERPFECHICQSKFRIAKILKNHMWVHTDDKPYKCQYCPKSCARLGRLKEHERRHHQNKKD